MLRPSPHPGQQTGTWRPVRSRLVMAAIPTCPHAPAVQILGGASEMAGGGAGCSRPHARRGDGEFATGPQRPGLKVDHCRCRRAAHLAGDVAALTPCGCMRCRAAWAEPAPSRGSTPMLRSWQMRWHSRATVAIGQTRQATPACWRPRFLATAESRPGGEQLMATGPNCMIQREGLRFQS